MSSQNFKTLSDCIAISLCLIICIYLLSLSCFVIVRKLDFMSHGNITYYAYYEVYV